MGRFSLFSKKYHFKKKLVIIALFSLIIVPSIFIPIEKASAQGGIVAIVSDLPKTLKDIWQKGASLALQQTLRSVLNKIAYDTANWIGSGGEGQQPLFVTESVGAYINKLGDEAAGTFLQNFSSNLGTSKAMENCGIAAGACDQACMNMQVPFEEVQQCLKNCQISKATCQKAAPSSGTALTVNLCSPSSLDVKVRIGLGLANQVRPQAPNCTATKMVDSWKKNIQQKYDDYTDPNFLSRWVEIFEPSSSDLGIYWESKNLLETTVTGARDDAKTKLLKDGGWLDKIGIDGKSVTLPGQAEIEAKAAQDGMRENLGKYTGDAFIDAAQLFINQVAMTGFNTLMKNLGKKTMPTSFDNNFSSGFQVDPNFSGGAENLKETTIKLIQPNFGTKANYDVLSELVVCGGDKEKPGPSNCVIDNKFMQAISEQKTVAAALKDGFLNSSWQFKAGGDGSSYENYFSWRNISVLRKYRIVPTSWEQVFVKMEQLDKENANKEGYQKKQPTLGDLVSCFSPYDEYNQFSNSFDASDQAWCTGLVDPSWVLKSPSGYCAKQGYGPEIISTTEMPSQKAFGSNPYTPSSISITRADNYCADYQTCIQEKDNGDCEYYGYCNEEKRVWSFSGDSCSPINNTCESFTNSDSRQQISYLKNTLDYEGCTVDNAGCKQYADSGVYNTSTGMVDWGSGSNFYFNNKLEECSVANEGCSEFIRVKPSWGANLVMNADFGNDLLGASTTSSVLNDWHFGPTNSKATIVDSSVTPGSSVGKALKLEGPTASLYSAPGASLLPDNLDIISGQAYTVSAYIYLAQGSKTVMTLGSGDDQAEAESTVTGTWYRLSLSKLAGSGLSSPSFSIEASGNAVVYIKDITFEMSGWDTGFSPYALKKVYQKVLPAYLESVCYEGETASGFNYQLKTGAPVQCYNYVLRCNRGDVGCELYSSANNFTIPAKVSTTDYCSSECVGYDMYIARESHFNSTQVENMIPSRAKSCSADAVGCSEFTNLDDLQTGGENKEYYSALKHCVKPGQASCASFYAWEGTSNGYQLRSYTLKADQDGPAVIPYDENLCSAEIYQADINSPIYNPDCKQFYNSSGEIFYHLYSQIITCSDNCRAYRMTEKNYDTSLTQDSCDKDYMNWDSQEKACIVCKNGGTWNSGQQACVYQGIPGEGKVCQSADKGCREFNGNNGNNIRLVSAYDFEVPSSEWSSNCINGISLSDISSNREGQSLFYNNSANNCKVIGDESPLLTKKLPLIKQIFASDDTTMSAQLKVGNSVRQNKAYNIKFWASSNNGADVELYFYNKETKEKAKFNGGAPIKILNNGGWQLYSANLENLGHQVLAGEMLIITADKSFYLDNFILTEITDRYYLIKSSSDIPDVCYYDMLDVYQGADYNLGCTSYSDRVGTTHNLHSFSDICDASSVGCEQVISTNNYSDYDSGIWGDEDEDGACDSNELDCVQVDQDKAMYLVYDVSKQCNVSDLGCSRLGQAQAGSLSSVWSDVFKKNNPNKYEQTLCGLDAVDCESWAADSGGFSYFRNPGNNVCVYRNSQTQPGSGKSWYKATAKRCDLNADGLISGNEMTGKVCLVDNDCGANSCITDVNDYLCEVSYLETIGNGGTGNNVPVPTKQVGLCDKQESGCTEYIDPVSKFNPNLALSSTDGNVINLKPNKLYIFESLSAGEADNRYLSFNQNVRPLLIDNTFGTTTKSIGIGGAVKNKIFYSLDNNQANISALSDVSVRELVTAYQLSSNIDKGCNGLTDFNNGCILFNERAIDGSKGYASLENAYDPYITPDKGALVKCDSGISGSCAANSLIQVRPDRACASWLACSTYSINEETGQKTCYGLGQCNSLDEKGDCNNFIENDYQPELANASGYALLNKYNISEMKEQGLNSQVHFNFEELIPSFSCQRKDDLTKPCDFNTGLSDDFIIREPEKSTVDYPAAGKSYLKVKSAYKISPQPAGSYISLSAGQDYYLNYLLNTEKAGGSAKITIEKSSGGATTFIMSSPNGWERKINTFNSGVNDVAIRIYIESDQSTNSGEIYIDDINIEPVLKTSNSLYTSRECRLYPEAGSLTCQSQTTDTVKEGLEGYCLEYDRDNKNVCSTWYPVDKISSSILNRTALGYSGPNGLSYCTNINSNIKFAKKVVAKPILANQDKTSGGKGGIFSDPNLMSLDASNCTVQTSGYYCTNFCGNCDYYKAILINNKDNWNYETIYCVPNETSDKLLITMGTPKSIHGLNMRVPNPGESSGCDRIRFYTEAWMEYDGTMAQVGVSTCSDGDCKPIDEYENADPPIRIYNPDYPVYDEQGLQLLAADASDRDKVFNFTCSDFAQVVSSSGDNQAWAVRTSSAASSEYSLNTPSFFKSPYNLNNLKLYGRQRNGIPYGAATFPNDYNLLSGGPVYLQNQYYQKDKQSIFAGRPYGCTGSSCDAVGYCSENPSVICVYNPTGTTNVAGIPCNNDDGCPSGSCLGNVDSCFDVYTGCVATTTGTDPNCGNYDSDDCTLAGSSQCYWQEAPVDCEELNSFECVSEPTYCSWEVSSWGSCAPLDTPDITPNNYINIKSCSDGGFGVCQPLWEVDSNGNVIAQDALKNIFRQSYGAFKYQQGYYMPSTGNWTTSGGAVSPVINNITLTKLGTTTPNLLIDEVGMYVLKFNTKVDREQQPLNMIFIDWGDGEKQAITGQDNREDINSPHVFYHYYAFDQDDYDITIKIWDNWDAQYTVVRSY